MKRKLISILLCVAMLHVTGCSKQEQSDNTQEYIDITNPTITESGVKQSSDLYLYKNAEIVDDYVLYPVDGMDIKVAIPNWKKENVELVDVNDMGNLGNTESGMLERMSLLCGKFKPMGATAYAGYIGLNHYITAGPQFILDTYDEVAKGGILKKDWRYISTAWESSTVTIDEKTEHVIKKADIECISVALYEGFYNNNPQANIKLYGITDEVYDRYLKAEDVKSGVSYRFYRKDLYEDYEAGKCELDILVDKDITESGRYYIDYKEVQGNKEYKQFLYVITYTNEPEEACAYSISSFQYDIQDEGTYNQWKEDNKQMFIK